MAGTERAWPEPLEDGTLLASKAKGIYKPGWTRYALSVRQSIGSPYLDREPVTRPDGTWSYLYFQEGEDPTTRDSQYTNRGLVECMKDRVPVGVMRQVSAAPRPSYLVLGLALVSGWEEGYFLLEGFAPQGRVLDPGPAAQIEALVAAREEADDTAGVFSPQGITDGRERTIASVVRRRGQPAFRHKLLELYGGRCAISGCDAVEALEAAHIVPYRGPGTNHPSNGLLLRADLHTLFDLGLISVDATSMTTIVAPRLSSTSYGDLAGKPVSAPAETYGRPSVEALEQHRVWSKL
jgi:putative restriction endonuclease